MNPVERNEKIFQAALGCTTAAVEFLRSVNKPINATYIAQNAWEIAKKLEEMMEVSIERESKALASGIAAPDTRPQSSASLIPAAANGNATKALKEEDLLALK
jgi:hypothetical protein